MRPRIFSAPPQSAHGKKKPKTEFERFDALAKQILSAPKKQVSKTTKTK